MATSVPFSFYASPSRGAIQPGPKSKPAQGLRRPASSTPSVGLLLSTGLEYTPRETPNSKVPESFTKQLSSPLEFPAMQIPEEAKTGSPLFWFEEVASVPLVEIPASTTTATASALQADAATSTAQRRIGETVERAAQEMTIAAESGRSLENIPEASVVVKENPVKRSEAVAGAQNTHTPSGNAAPKKSAAKDVLQFYDLPQQPFDVTPDPAYLYFTPSHREALASLKDGIGHCRGFMVLAAEPGMGKTTLLNKLMDDLSDSAQVVFLFQTQCSSRDLLCFILNELEVDHAGMDVVGMHRALNQALLEEMLRGRRFVLIVDEAQNLQEPVLETIRLLSDFETTHSKLIQIILAGQPQLAETLMRPGLVQLRQRIAVLSSLQTLSAAEIAEYIEHRLRASGWKGSDLFTQDAVAQIAKSSQGIPRRINNLCFNALLEGFHRGLEVIDADIVKIAAGKLNLESLVRRPQPDASPEPTAAPVSANGASELAHALVAALTAEARSSANPQPTNAPQAKPEAILTGNLTEKVRSQGWSERHEYRILVTLDRVPVNGLHIADRYYCCSMYMGESQAAALKAGKPVRIKIEQD